MNQTLFPDLVINGETVPHALVAAEVQNHAAPRGKPGIAWRKAARAVAVRTLLLQEARRRGLSPQGHEVAPGRVETPDEARIRVLLDQSVSVTPPDDAAIRAEWARDPGRFRAPPLWQVSHLLIACDPRDDAARDQGLARARSLADQAQANPAGFGRLAAAHSDCASAAVEGSLGQIGPGDTVPEFEAVLRDLPEGAITEAPVLTRHGWHIIRMDAMAPGAVLPFDSVRGAIAEAMERTAWARAARAFVETLVAAASIEGAVLRDPGVPASAPDRAGIEA